MPWRLIEETRIVITVGDLDIWPDIVGKKEQEMELEKKEDWNTEIEIINKERLKRDRII